MNSADPASIDRPIHTIVVAFAFTGSLLLLLSKIYPSFYRSRKAWQKHTPLPLRHFHRRHSSRDPSPDSQDNGDTISTISIRSFRINFLLTLAALIVRTELLRRTLNRIECTQLGIEVRNPPLGTSHSLIMIIVHCTLYTGPLRLLFVSPKREAFPSIAQSHLLQRYQA